jgi:hypothetical protein
MRGAGKDRVTAPLIENVEDGSFLSIAVTVFATLAAFTILTALAVFTVATVILLRRRWYPLRRRRRGCLRSGSNSFFGRRGHEFFQFAAIQPHSTAHRAHVKLHAAAIHRVHGAVVVWA